MFFSYLAKSSYGKTGTVIGRFFNQQTTEPSIAGFLSHYFLWGCQGYHSIRLPTMSRYCSP